MRAIEFIIEADIHASAKKLQKDQEAALKGALSIPGISMNKANGSSYTQYRFGLAMAGAPEYPTQAAGALAGDPLLSTYTDEEFEIIKFAAKQVGAGSIRKLTKNRSEEIPTVNKTSPVPAPKKNKYGV